MKKYRIEHSNTAVRKLWTLARNGIFSYKTINDIFKNEEDGYIVFNSKKTYERFKEYQYSPLAMNRY
jgi:hypothetical protein